METMTQVKPGQASWTSNPTPANTPEAELTEMIREERYERTLKNIARRAETLWEDGYTVEKGREEGCYFVNTPAGETYNLMVHDPVFGEYCDCPSWKKYGNCKHHIAVTALVDEGAEGDALELAESATTGTDPYARY